MHCRWKLPEDQGLLPQLPPRREDLYQRESSARLSLSWPYPQGLHLHLPLNLAVLLLPERLLIGESCQQRPSRLETFESAPPAAAASPVENSSPLLTQNPAPRPHFWLQVEHKAALKVRLPLGFLPLDYSWNIGGLRGENTFPASLPPLPLLPWIGEYIKAQAIGSEYKKSTHKHIMTKFMGCSEINNAGSKLRG